MLSLTLLWEAFTRKEFAYSPNWTGVIVACLQAGVPGHGCWALLSEKVLVSPRGPQ